MLQLSHESRNAHFCIPKQASYNGSSLTVSQLNGSVINQIDSGSTINLIVKSLPHGIYHGLLLR